MENLGTRHKKPVGQDSKGVKNFPKNKVARKEYALDKKKTADIRNFTNQVNY